MATLQKVGYLVIKYGVCPWSGMFTNHTTRFFENLDNAREEGAYWQARGYRVRIETKYTTG